MVCIPLDVVIWNVCIVAGPAPVLGVIPVTVTGVVTVGVEPEGDATTIGAVRDLLISWRTVTMGELFNLTGVLFMTATETGAGTGIWISGTEEGCMIGACETGLVAGIGTDDGILLFFADAGLLPTPDERRCSLRGFLTLLGIP